MTCSNYSTCRHGHPDRCDGTPGDDCYERKPDTEPCPPPPVETYESTPSGQWKEIG